MKKYRFTIYFKNYDNLKNDESRLVLYFSNKATCISSFNLWKKRLKNSIFLRSPYTFIDRNVYVLPFLKHIVGFKFWTFVYFEIWDQINDVCIRSCYL